MAKTAAGVYRPRRPERTVLYRVLAQHFERFLQVYDERFAPSRGALPPGAQAAVHRYLDCGIFESGFARVRCGECGHDFFVAFSCKLRCLCPSCHIKRELLWAQWATQELLEDVPHRQLVLTIPRRLRPYFGYDRSLLGDLAGCAWRALRLAPERNDDPTRLVVTHHVERNGVAPALAADQPIEDLAVDQFDAIQADDAIAAFQAGLTTGRVLVDEEHGKAAVRALSNRCSDVREERFALAGNAPYEVGVRSTHGGYTIATVLDGHRNDGP